jgi:pyruvate/2-oxoglutarate dehydrogenase complex dihydrolipoamide dehydrogenase (E3) component
MASFTETLSGIRRGRFLEIIDKQLTKLLREIAEVEGGGSISVEIKFTHKAEGQLIATGKVKTKAPTPDAGEAIFYVTEDGELERTDPRQIDFDDILDRKGNPKTDR